MTTIKTTIRVNFIGRIWMPACVCASSFTIGDSDKARFTEPFNLTSDEECIEFVEHFLYTSKSGDFQSITDYEAIREVTTTTETRDNGKRTIQSKSEYTPLRDWKDEDSQFAWVDATYGVEA